MKAILAVCLLALCVALAKAAPKPHVVYLLVDDLGHYNTEITNPDMKTPHIAKLASEGILLDRFYVYKYCSPTRSSLLSGRLPIHVNEQNKDNTYPFAGIPPEMTTLPAKLKKAGYSTYAIGKWHLGLSQFSRLPVGRGFDEHLGYLGGSEDHYTEKTGGGDCGSHPDLWKNELPAVGMNNTGYAGYMYNKKALELISSHDSSKPMFLYMAFQNCHNPLQVPDKYKDMYPGLDNENRQKYMGMASFADEAIENITTLLKAKKMWDNTLIIFSTDNGGPTYKGGAANNYPLKGGKHSDWEGGVRGIAFVSGGFLPSHTSGTTVNGYIHVCDWYATLCKLAGVDAKDVVPGLPNVDSLDVWPLITGANKTSPRTEIPLSSFPGRNQDPQAIQLIKGNYKLLQGSQWCSGWTGMSYPNATTEKHDAYVGDSVRHNCGSGCLFDIINDPSEYHDLSSEQPKILEAMKTRAAEIFKTVYDPDRGKSSKEACRVIKEKWSGFWGPWLNDTEGAYIAK